MKRLLPRGSVAAMALAVAATMFTCTGCGQITDDGGEAAGEAVSEYALESSMTTDMTGSLESLQDSATAGDTGNVAGEDSLSEQAAIERELEAIERELDMMSLPDDSDFDAIEDVLE